MSACQRVKTISGCKLQVTTMAMPMSSTVIQKKRNILRNRLRIAQSPASLERA